MDKDEEIKKEKLLKNKHSTILILGSLFYLGIAIEISLFVKWESPLIEQVLIPLSIGIATGLILSIVSIEQNYKTSVRLIEIQSTNTYVNKKQEKSSENNFELMSDKIDLKKTLIVSIISVTILVLLFVSYLYFENINVQEEELGFSMYYMENVTQIDSAIIDLNFIENTMIFTSKFNVDGDGIRLDSNSKGFQNSDNNCSDDLNLKLSDGREQGLTWHDKQSVLFSEYGKVNYVELTKTCKFNREITPNGEFTVHLFGKNQTVGVLVSDLKFKTSFDSKIFDCDDECVYAKNFIYTDFINSEENIRDVLLEGTDVDTRYVKFDLRSFNMSYEKLSNFFFTMFQLGVGVAITVIIFVFSHDQQNRLSRIIQNINNISNQQQKLNNEQIKTRDHKRKRYSKMILFGLQQIDYELEGIVMEQNFRDVKDITRSDDDRKKSQIKYYEKAQKIFLEIGVEYDDILEVFTPEIENQYRIAWNTLRTPLLYFKNNFDNSLALKKSLVKIYTEFGELKDQLLVFVNESEKKDYSELFDLAEFDVI